MTIKMEEGSSDLKQINKMMSSWLRVENNISLLKESKEYLRIKFYM